MWQVALEKGLFKLTLEGGKRAGWRCPDGTGLGTVGRCQGASTPGSKHEGTAGGPFCRGKWELMRKGPCLLPTRVKLPEKMLGGTLESLGNSSNHLIKPTDLAFGPAYNHKYPTNYCASEGPFVFLLLFLLLFCFYFLSKKCNKNG